MHPTPLDPDPREKPTSAGLTKIGTTGPSPSSSAARNLLPRGSKIHTDTMAATLSRPTPSFPNLQVPPHPSLDAVTQMSPRLQPQIPFGSLNATGNQPSSPTSSYSSSASFPRSTAAGKSSELPPLRPIRSDLNRLPPRSQPNDTEDQSDSSVRSHGIKRSYDMYATTRPPPITTIYPKPSSLGGGLPQPFSTPQSPIHPPPSTASATLTPRPPPITMPDSRYTLHLRQNPRAARAGPDGKDRRTIDPPPVLQLLIDDFDPHEARDIAMLKAHDWVVHAKLISAEAPHEDLTTVATHPERGHNSKVTRLLLGTTVSSPFFCADDPDSENAPQHPRTTIAAPPSPTAEILKIPTRGRDASSRRPDAYKTYPGAFFIFPDLSIRKAGQYRLEFRLMKMTPDVLIPGRIVPTISIAVSDIFNVVNAKDFDQVQPSTDLVKGLLDRGAGFPLKLKKGLREGQRKKGRSGDSDDDDDGDGDGDGDEDGDGTAEGRDDTAPEADENEDEND